MIFHELDYQDLELRAFAQREMNKLRALEQREQDELVIQRRLQAVLPPTPARPNVRQILKLYSFQDFPLRSNVMTRNFQLLYGGRLGRRGCMPQSLTQLEAQHAQLQAQNLKWRELAQKFALDHGFQLDPDPSPEHFFAQVEGYLDDQRLEAAEEYD